MSKLCEPANYVWFLTICGPFPALPDFLCEPSPRLPSRQTNRRKTVKTEISNKEGTDTSGGSQAKAVPNPSGGNLSIANWDTSGDTNRLGLFGK